MSFGSVSAITLSAAVPNERCHCQSLEGRIDAILSPREERNHQLEREKSLLSLSAIMYKKRQPKKEIVFSLK